MYDINVLTKSVYDLVLEFSVDYDTSQIAEEMIYSILEELSFGLRPEKRDKSPSWWRRQGEPAYAFRTTLVDIVLNNIGPQEEMESTVCMLDELLEALQLGLDQANRYIPTGRWPVR